MSQAFVKEGDQSDDLPERPIPDRPNYVTPGGLEALKAWQKELADKRTGLIKRKSPETEARLKVVERDLRYVEIRIASAVLIDRSQSKPDDVRFGAKVEVEGQDGKRTWTIVGEDEADQNAGKLSWAAPLALALMGAKPGDVVNGPDGSRLKILAFDY